MADRRILNVEKLASGGDGIAFSDGQVVFIPFSIPASGSLPYYRRDCGFSSGGNPGKPFGFPISGRSPCPLFGDCGGCDLQHIEYSRQLELKGQIFAESLSRIASFRNKSSAFGHRLPMPIGIGWNFT
jgi:tRNA/tmRNA/rRNA uracil-C5-methylase (TrmA/RlmC/RlmD family)